jgi:lipoprotein NlpI
MSRTAPLKPDEKENEILKSNKEHAAFVREQIELKRITQAVAKGAGSKQEAAQLEAERDALTDRLGLHIARAAREMQRDNPSLSLINALSAAVHSLAKA